MEAAAEVAGALDPAERRDLEIGAGDEVAQRGGREEVHVAGDVEFVPRRLEEARVGAVEVGDLGEHDAARPEDPADVAGEGEHVGDVFEHVKERDDIERRGREVRFGERPLSDVEPLGAGALDGRRVHLDAGDAPAAVAHGEEIEAGAAADVEEVAGRKLEDAVESVGMAASLRAVAEIARHGVEEGHPAAAADDGEVVVGRVRVEVAGAEDGAVAVAVAERAAARHEVHGASIRSDRPRRGLGSGGSMSKQVNRRPFPSVGFTRRSLPIASG